MNFKNLSAETPESDMFDLNCLLIEPSFAENSFTGRQRTKSSERAV